MPSRHQIATDLAAFLARVISEVLPDGLTVSASNSGQLEFRSWSGSCATSALDEVLVQSELKLADAICTALHAALSMLQDFVSEELTISWPDGQQALPRVDILSEKRFATGFSSANDRWILQLPTYETCAG
jgi:hypothetical protein